MTGFTLARTIVGFFVLGLLVVGGLPAGNLSPQEQELLLQTFSPLALPLQTPVEFPDTGDPVEYTPLPASIAGHLGFEYAYSSTSFAVGRVSLPDEIELLLSFRDDSGSSVVDRRYDLHVYDTRWRQVVASHLFGLELTRPSQMQPGPGRSQRPSPAPPGPNSSPGAQERRSSQLRSGKLSNELRLTIRERYLSETGPIDGSVVEFEAEQTEVYLWNGSARSFTLQ